MNQTPQTLLRFTATRMWGPEKEHVGLTSESENKNEKSRKGKAVPLQAWSGPKCSRKLRFPDFMTTAQDDGKFVSLTHQPPLPPGNTPGTHFC